VHFRRSCNQHQQADARCCYIPAKNGVPVSASHYAAPQLIIFRVRARFYFYLAQRVGGRRFLRVAFFSLSRKAHTKVPFKSLALLDSQPSSFAAPLQTRGKTT
jgi:hypothetical protein